MLSVNGLNQYYGGSHILRDVAFEARLGEVTVVLVGMRNERELQENTAAADWKLSAADRAEIDRIFVEEGVPTYVDAKQAV